MKISIAGIAFSIMFLVTVPLGALAENAAVDCDTAQADIAHQQHEKKSTDERIAKGVFSIMPIERELVLSFGDGVAIAPRPGGGRGWG